MIIDADDKTGNWKGSHHYRFLIPPDGDKLDLAIKLRDIIDDKPPTCARINLSNHLPDKETARLNRDLVYFVGAWPDPWSDHVYTNIINPNYQGGLHEHSDIMTWCECGAATISTNNSKTYNKTVEEHDGCTIYHRQELSAKVSRKRASLLRTVLRLDYPATHCLPRFGMKADTLATSVQDNLGIDIEKERENGRRMAANTMAHLIFDYPPDEIGRAFDLTGDAVNRKIRKFTAVEPYDAYKERRWG